MEACIIVLRVMHHNTHNSRLVIQITKKRHLCIHTHKWRSHDRSSLSHQLNSLGGPSRERGANMAPYDDTWGQILDRQV